MQKQIREISKHLNGFGKDVFTASVASYNDARNPLRVNNFATNLRELSRLVLDELAPESEIKKCCWYKPVLNQQQKPVITRAQRITYAVQGGLPAEFVSTKLRIDVPRVTKKHGEIIEKLSKFTHVGPKTFNVPKREADRLANASLDMFLELLQTIEKCRDKIHRALERSAQEALLDEMFTNTVAELDEIATHHTVNYAHLEELELIKLGSVTIEFKGSGSVDCELQYGSDGDYERGDGMRMNDNYPLTCEFHAMADTPLELRVENLRVDNSSFYE